VPIGIELWLFAVALGTSMLQQMLARRKDPADSSSVRRLPLGMTLMYGA
jgi:hypothetical protein